MDGTSILMAAGVFVSALLTFGGGMLISEAKRSDKVQPDEKKQPDEQKQPAEKTKTVEKTGMGKGVLVPAATAMLAASLTFGELLVGQADRTEDTSDMLLEMTTEASTEAPTEAPTEPPTEAPTEPPTEAPTEPPTPSLADAPTVLLPFEKVIDTYSEKAGNYTGGFFCPEYADGTICICGFWGDYVALHGGNDVLTIPLQNEDYIVRAVDTAWADWTGISVIRIPEGMPVTEWDTILSPEQAKSYFAQNGITLEYYDPAAEPYEVTHTKPVVPAFRDAGSNMTSENGLWVEHCLGGSNNTGRVFGIVDYEDEAKLPDYDAIFGGHETVTIPLTAGEWNEYSQSTGEVTATHPLSVKEIIFGGLLSGQLEEFNWAGVKHIRIPEDSDIHFYACEEKMSDRTELTFEKLKEQLAENGITLETYDPATEADPTAETEAPTEAAAQEE